MWSLEKVMPKTYHVNFKRNDLMGMFFLRLQEFYESPKFKNKFFTLDDFKNWYSAEYGSGHFTYYEDWSGYNITSCSMRECVKFYKKHRKKLTEIEIQSFKMFEFIDSIENEEWALIGTYGKNSEQRKTLDHELAHAMFANVPKYKKSVIKLVKKLPIKTVEKSCKELMKVGYDRQNYLDECNAYWSTGVMNKNMEIPFKFKKMFEDNFFKFKDEQISELKAQIGGL